LDLYRAAGSDAVASSSSKKSSKRSKKSAVPKASDTSGKQQILEFYSGPEYLRWRNEVLKSNSDDSVEDVFAKKKLVVKYYKGLGTNTAKEGREYFQNLDKHRKIFTYHDENEDLSGSSSRSDNYNYLTLGDKESRQHDLIDMAFSKERVNDRRNWLTNIYEPDDFINPTKPTVSYDDFVNKELIMFSTADNLRSIPSVVDGLKPSQRKVCFLFTLFF
jgi:DNA topoisomerase-2